MYTNPYGKQLAAFTQGLGPFYHRRPWFYRRRFKACIYWGCPASQHCSFRLTISRCQTLSSIAQHRRGKGLVAFPGDYVSFPLGLGKVINVNRRFDLRERFGRVCARAMALALESDLRTVIGLVARWHGYTVYRRNSCPRLRSSYLDKMSLYISLPTGFRKSCHGGNNLGRGMRFVVPRQLHSTITPQMLHQEQNYLGMLSMKLLGKRSWHF